MVNCEVCPDEQKGCLQNQKMETKQVQYTMQQVCYCPRETHHTIQNQDNKKFVALFNTLMVHNSTKITSATHGSRSVLKRAKTSKNACLKMILYFFKIKNTEWPISHFLSLLKFNSQVALMWLLSETSSNQLVAVAYELVTNYTQFALKDEHSKCFEVQSTC